MPLIGTLAGRRFLVVVDDFDIECVSFLKPEAQAPLPVDADAVLACAVTLKKLQPVGGRRSQVLNLGRAMQHLQLSLRDALKGGPAQDSVACKQCLGVSTLERLNQSGKI
jgi:hypothetical protein